MSILRRRRHDGATTHVDREGPSLAKGPVLVVGTILVAFGLAALITNSDFPSASSQFPDGTAQGETFLGIEVNGWTNWGSIAAGALLLFGLARHWMAKTMALVVGLALGAAAVIALIDGEDVLGLAATNGWTKLAMGIAAAVLLVTALLPRAGRRRHHDDDVATTHRADVTERRADPDAPVVDRDPDHGHHHDRDDTAVGTGRFTREEAATEVRPPGDSLHRR